MKLFEKIKNYLRNEFLPGWAKEDLTNENEDLKKLIEEQKLTIERQSAYIDGLETGLKAMRRIRIINNTGDRA